MALNKLCVTDESAPLLELNVCYMPIRELKSHIIECRYESLFCLRLTIYLSLSLHSIRYHIINKKFFARV